MLIAGDFTRELVDEFVENFIYALIVILTPSLTYLRTFFIKIYIPSVKEKPFTTLVVTIYINLGETQW